MLDRKNVQLVQTGCTYHTLGRKQQDLG